LNFDRIVILSLSGLKIYLRPDNELIVKELIELVEEKKNNPLPEYLTVGKMLFI
jgi:hypothetical protein